MYRKTIFQLETNRQTQYCLRYDDYKFVGEIFRIENKHSEQQQWPKNFVLGKIRDQNMCSKWFTEAHYRYTQAVSCVWWRNAFLLVHLIRVQVGAYLAISNIPGNMIWCSEEALLGRMYWLTFLNSTQISNIVIKNFIFYRILCGV